MLVTAVSALIGFGLGYALLDIFETDSKDDDVENEPLVGSVGETLSGTDGDDLIRLAFGEEDAHLQPTVIDAGGGDDVLDLTETEDGQNITLARFSQVNGGDGNDAITVRADSSTILGGSGDDSIEIVDGFGGLVDGGDGNDTITIDNRDTDPIDVFGGSGDDVINGRNVNNGLLDGGEGNDLIIQAFGDQGGAGYVIRSFGGDGNDTIEFDGRGFESSMGAASLFGGSGEDTFRVTFDDTPAGIDEFEEGIYDNPVSVDIIVLDDFQPGEDSIVVEPIAEIPGFSLASGTIEPDTETGITKLVFTYQSETNEDRAVNIVVNSLGVTWDDVTFADGLAPSVLVPSA